MPKGAQDVGLQDGAILRFHHAVENIAQGRVGGQPCHAASQAKAHQHVIVDAQHVSAQPGIQRVRRRGDRGVPGIEIGHGETPFRSQYIVICDDVIKAAIGLWSQSVNWV